MLDFRRRVPSKGPLVDPLAENPAEVLRGVAQQIADECGLGVDHAAFDRAADHMDRPVAVKCRYAHPPGSRCPACAEVPSNVTVIPAPEARSRA